MPAERIESLDYSERWLRDGLRAMHPAGGIVTVEVDMSRCAALRTKMAEAGTPVTYTHIIVHATAATLAQHPELHRLVAGNRRLIPDTVDVCLSIAGDAAVTPVLVIRDAGRKSLVEIAEEIRTRAAEAKCEDEQRLRLVKRWGWLVPLAFLRKTLVRLLLNRIWYRRLASGTFQVTAVPSVDLAIPLLFNTAAALGAGRVRERPVALDGRVEIRPILVLVCCCDHTVWNGMDASAFLNSIKNNLECSS